MAKVKAPLMSIRASGSIGDALTYGSWRGIPYARQLVIPSNPNSAAQQLTRNAFRWLTDLFRMLGPIARQPWEVASSGRPLTDRNFHVKGNLPQLRTAVVVDLYSGSPGAKGGPALASFVAATGVAAKSVKATMDIGTLPTGWTLTAFKLWAIQQQNPQEPLVLDINEGTAASPGPKTIELVMKEASTAYVLAGWAVYARDDGTVAVSPSEVGNANSQA